MQYAVFLCFEQGQTVHQSEVIIENESMRQKPDKMKADNYAQDIIQILIRSWYTF
mgnify:CR=1 FL=1